MTRLDYIVDILLIVMLALACFGCTSADDVRHPSQQIETSCSKVKGDSPVAIGFRMFCRVTMDIGVAGANAADRINQRGVHVH